MSNAQRDAAAAAAVIGTLLVALGAWLLVPRERAPGSPTLPPLRICLVDVSPSAVWRRKDWPSWIERTLAGEAEAAARAREDLCTILYGSEVRRDFGPAPASTYPSAAKTGVQRFQEPFLFAGESGSRLSQALEAALGLVRDPARASASVLVIGDGTFTGADPSPLVRELVDAGAAFERLDLPPPVVAELALGPLALPRAVEAGAPIAVECDVFYAPGAGQSPLPRVPVGLERTSAAGVRRSALQLAVPPGLAPDDDGYLRWRFRGEVGRAEPGLETVRLEGWRAIQAPDFENDAWSEGVVRCSGRRVVGVVTSERRQRAGDRPSGVLALAGDDGLQIENVWIGELAARIVGLDALVTCDLAPEDLPGDVLSSFVERGGGWLCLAGDRFLRGFLPRKSTAHDDFTSLLPLQPPDENPEPRDVVVLVDRSGSMAGEPLENVRRAVLALVDAALARDSVELRFFGDRLSDSIPLKTARDAREPAEVLRAATERFRAGAGTGGSTAVARSLETFVAERERAGREALVFLLTDGRDTLDPDAKQRCAKLLPRFAAARARLVVIAAGVDPDRELLSSLVAGEEPLRAVGALAASSAPLADIFRREISANRTRQGPSLRVLPAADLLDPSAASAPGAEILRAQRPDLAASWPAIQRYARAKVAPHAAAIWNSERGEPLLAIHRVGLGAIAACAFAPTEGWGAGWAGRQDLWGPILRALARGKPDVSPCVRIAGDELTVEDLPLDAPPELEARVFAADAQAGAAPTAVLRLSPASTGGDPRRTRSARWPSEMRDALESADAAQFPRVELHARGPHATWSPLVLPLAIPHAPEFVLPRPRFRADDGAARPLAAAHPQRAVRAHPAAPEVLFSGLFLLTFAGLAGFFARRAR